jgi:hypothetical protein
MTHRFTTLALAGMLLVGAAACADSTDDLEQALLIEEATSRRSDLDPGDKAALADIISDFADIASVVPDLFDYEPDTDIATSGDFELTCAGGLEPTVIFTGRDSTTWPDVDVAEASADLFGARVCTYGAPGIADPSTPAEIAAEATAATAGIRANGSVTVVGRSDEPEAAELFAQQHPADVVGVTMLDAGSGWTDLDWRDLYGR